MRKNRKIAFLLAAVMTMSGTTALAGQHMESLVVDPDEKDIATAYLDGSWNSSATYGEAMGQTYYTFEYPETNYDLAVRVERFETNSYKYKEYKYDKDKINAKVRLPYAKTYCFKSRHSVDNPRTHRELEMVTFADYN